MRACSGAPSSLRAFSLALQSSSQRHHRHKSTADTLRRMMNICASIIRISASRIVDIALGSDAKRMNSRREVPPSCAHSRTVGHAVHPCLRVRVIALRLLCCTATWRTCVSNHRAYSPPLCRRASSVLFAGLAVRLDSHSLGIRRDFDAGSH
jgi:hypothetical protein